MSTRCAVFDELMSRRLVGVAVVCICVLALTATGALGAESLKVAVGADPAVEQPLGVTVEGVANGLDDLYVFAATGECAPDPQEEASETFEVRSLSGAGAHAYGVAEGEALGTGDFERSYTFTPWAPEDFVLCAYLGEGSSAPPGARAQASFALSGAGIVKAPYLQEAVGEMKQITVEHSQQEQHEREQRQREKEERERIPPTEQLHAEPPRFVPPPTIDSRKKCVVPTLEGLSLAKARTALRHAGCRLGAVTRRGHPRGALVVLRQSARHGSRVRAGAAVAVVLGVPR
jgi:hypothetical protein